MPSIVVGFSRPTGWFEPFSWLIRLVTWSPVSHAYVRYYDDYAKKDVVFQASGLKVNMIEKSTFDAVEYVYAEFEIPVSEGTKLKLIQFAIDNLGLPYGIWQVFGFLWVYLMKAFNKNVNNPLYSTSSDFCSEIVTRLLEDIPGLGDTQNPGVSTPKDVCNFLLSKGFKNIR